MEGGGGGEVSMVWKRGMVSLYCCINNSSNENEICILNFVYNDEVEVLVDVGGMWVMGLCGGGRIRKLGWWKRRIVVVDLVVVVVWYGFGVGKRKWWLIIGLLLLILFDIFVVVIIIIIFVIVYFYFFVDVVFVVVIIELLCWYVSDGCIVGFLLWVDIECCEVEVV